MHLAVFGGSFDPPHNGHLALCLFARELLEIDRILVSVSNNPFKKNRCTADAHRKSMAELLSLEINLTGACCEVSGWELEKRGPSYTVELLHYVHSLYPNARLTLLLGEDSVRELSTWKDYEQLILLCDIAVFRRASAGFSTPLTETPYRNGVLRFIDFANPVSSSDIRELAAAGQSITRYAPLSVCRYISRHGLYRHDHDPTLTPELKHPEF